MLVFRWRKSFRIFVIKQWLDELTEAGPNLGYYPNAKKCWLITKPEKVEDAQVIFEGTAINISTQGQKHLGQP